MQNNRPVGEAMSRLQELAIISGETRGEIEQLISQKEGAKAFGVLEESMGRFSGTMARMSQTASGRISTMKDNFFMAGAEVGTQILPALGVAIEKAIGKMQGLSETGDLEKLGQAIAPVANSAFEVASAFADVITHQNSLDAMRATFDAMAASAEILAEVLGVSVGRVEVSGSSANQAELDADRASTLSQILPAIAENLGTRLFDSISEGGPTGQLARGIVGLFTETRRTNEILIGLKAGN
jgi:hypothetical protein